MQRNRESASLSRQRKKMLSEEKENQVLELQKHCAGLTGEYPLSFWSFVGAYDNGAGALSTCVEGAVASPPKMLAEVIGPIIICKQGADWNASGMHRS